MVKEVGAGCTSFWSGRNIEERHDTGVGFARRIVKRHQRQANYIETLFVWQKYATIISSYAPTMTNSVEEEDKFYDELDSNISAASRPCTDKLILLGDFNARVDTDHQTWKGVIASECASKCNRNDLLLLRKCAEHAIRVFRLPNRTKTSWMHPRSKQWHVMDYAKILLICNSYSQIMFFFPGYLPFHLIECKLLFLQNLALNLS